MGIVSVSDSEVNVPKVLFSLVGKESGFIFSTGYLTADKEFAVFDVQVELMGKSQKGVKGPKQVWCSS